MNELAQLYEKVGRLTVANETLLAEYRKLLGLFLRVKAGEVDPQTIDILPGDSWAIRPKTEAPPVAPV